MLLLLLLLAWKAEVCYGGEIFCNNIWFNLPTFRNFHLAYKRYLARPPSTILTWCFCSFSALVVFYSQFSFHIVHWYVVLTWSCFRSVFSLFCRFYLSYESDWIVISIIVRPIQCSFNNFYIAWECFSLAVYKMGYLKGLYRVYWYCICLHKWNVQYHPYCEKS